MGTFQMALAASKTIAGRTMLVSHDQEPKPVQSQKLTIPSSRYPVGHRTASEIAMDRDNVNRKKRSETAIRNNCAGQASENQFYFLKLSRIASINKDYDGGKWCIKCPITRWFVRDGERGHGRQH